MKKLLLIGLVIVLTACATPGRSDFDRNQKKWQETQSAHYRFELSMVCFCAFRNQMPLKIEVLNEQVVSMTGADGSLIAATDPNYKYFSRYATINRLFTELHANLSGQADQVIVSYHPSYGFPTQIDIDRIKGAADDELGLIISGFERLR